MTTHTSQLRLLERAIAASRNGIVIADANQPKNPIIYCNQAFEKMTGYTSAEVMGQNCRFLQGPETDPLALEKIRNALHQGQEIQVVLKNYRKDRTYFWNELSISPLRDETGKLTHFIGVQNDITDSKNTEFALQSSEARFQKVAANIPGVIYQLQLNLNGNMSFTYVSSGCQKLLGLELEELYNSANSFIERIHPDHRYSFNKSIAASASSLQSWRWEGRFILPSGQIKWIQGTSCPELANNGNIVWDGLLVDISDSKQAEIELKIANEQLEDRVQERTAALQESQQMLRWVIDNIPQAVFWKDRNLVFLGCNQKVAKIAGFSDPSEIVGKTDWDMPWKPEETEFFRATDLHIMETNTPQYHIIESQQGADGQQRWLDTNKIPLHDANGNVVGILGSFEDITERIILENKVRESEELFRKIFEDAPIGIDLANLDDTMLVGVNKAFCEMLGYTEAELLKKTFIDITHPEDIDKNKLLAEAAEREEISNYKIEKRFITATGEIVWVNVTATIIRDAEGKAIYNLGMIENISDRKLSEVALRESEAQLRKQATQLQQAYDQLQQAQSKLVHTEKMSSLGQMVAGIAHEINNPVTFINGNIAYACDYFNDFTDVLQLYQEHYPSPHPQITEKIEAIELDFLIDDLPKMLTSIKMGAERISQIVRSLRNFSRLDEADKKFADIHEGIDNTLLILQHRLNRSGQKGSIKIVKKYGKIPKVECCAGQLNQVFMNIISNAIDALIDQPEPRTIAIATSLGTGELRLNREGENRELASFSNFIPESSAIDAQSIAICIADNGPGMTEETRLRLFNPFFTTKPVGSGTGLGLSISYEIVVQKHGGTLRCLSTPGQGAEFWIEIPLRSHSTLTTRESESIKG